MPALRWPNNNLSINQSRNLPFWLWLAIAASLGIKHRDGDKPIIASILYVISFSSSLGLIVSTWWFTVYDIMSDYTKTTVISGSVLIIYTIFWASLGIYTNQLAYRLYSHPHFTRFLKLHSRTIFKMNAAVLLFLLMGLFVIVNNISGFFHYKGDLCITVGLSVMLCRLQYIFRVIFSITALLWNYLVAFAVISICRSHVLRMRKFMEVLDLDSKDYESRFLGMTDGDCAETTYEECVISDYSWEEDYYSDELEDINNSEICRYNSYSTKEFQNNNNSSASLSREENIPETSTSVTAVNLEFINTKVSDKKSVTPSLSNDEILFHYWKIQTDLRISSGVLQRWMMSIISLVTIWLAMNMVVWLKNEPNVVDLANFFLPLLLLPLLTSAYAEVNQQGYRILKYICLLDVRVEMLTLLRSAPLQMTVYSYSLSYSTIGNASFGLLIALSSQILLREIFGKQ